MAGHEVLLCLLKHGVNAVDYFLGTPLVHAALRAGADETIVDVHGYRAADMTEKYVGRQDCLTEDFERVRELLANAPADRVWRRRRYLVLCVFIQTGCSRTRRLAASIISVQDGGLSAAQRWRRQGRSQATPGWMRATVATGPLWC